jgi:arginine-tRNA-protein transferase
VPDRSQRRCLRRNADLTLDIVSPRHDDEIFSLYRRYLEARHAGAGMDDPGEEDFDRFLACAWSPTRFFEWRAAGELIAVAVTDVLPQGLSAVYTFFSPEAAARSLGTWAILSQIAWARAQALPHLYLGYWIAQHPKMHYKARYRPLELLREGQWTRD